MPEEPPKEENVSDEQVGSLISTVLDKMGVKDMPKVELARAQAETEREAHLRAQDEARKGEQENLKNLVDTLKSFEKLLRALALAVGPMAKDTEYMKRIIKRNAKSGRLAEALDSSEDTPAVGNGKS